MAKKFIRTTSENFNNLSDKSQYKDSIVFIEDINMIWTNNKYYGEHTSSDFNNDFSLNFNI